MVRSLKGLRWVFALAALLALIAAALVNSNGSATAEKWPVPIPAQPVALALPAQCSVLVTDKTEVLHVSHGDYNGYMVIQYGLSPVLTNPDCAGSHLGHRFVDIDTMTWTTGDPYQADILKVTAETSPGNYSTVVHFGGDGTPQNTVSSGWSSGARPRIWITDPSDSPAWGLYDKGFENSTTNVDTDYGVI